MPHEPRSRKRWLALSALLVVGVAVAAASALALGAFSQPSAAARHKSALALLRAHLIGPFEDAMRQRESFFVAERSFIAAMADANRKLSAYKGAQKAVEREDREISNAVSGQESACESIESTVPCPKPTYPSFPTAPEVRGDITRLRHAVTELGNLKATVLSVAPPAKLKVFYAQLESAITTLSSNAQSNADTLEQGVTEPVPSEAESNGNVELQKIETLEPEEALPAIKVMNQQALDLIHELKLDIGQYDVPGGTDADPSDHSNLQ